MEFYKQGDLLLEIVKVLKKYGESNHDIECFSGRLRLTIEPSDIKNLHVESIQENIKEMINENRPGGFFKYRVWDSTHNLVLLSFYFLREKRSWKLDVEDLTKTP
jgi:hypothetical protein